MYFNDVSTVKAATWTLRTYTVLLRRRPSDKTLSRLCYNRERFLLRKPFEITLYKIHFVELVNVHCRKAFHSLIHPTLTLTLTLQRTYEMSVKSGLILKQNRKKRKGNPPHFRLTSEDLYFRWPRFEDILWWFTLKSICRIRPVEPHNRHPSLPTRLR